MKYIQRACIIILFCFLASGCAISSNQGRMVRSGEVDQLIESAAVLPDHTYYYTGPGAEPDAIVALDNRFTLQSKYWVRVDDVAEQLKRWDLLLDNDTRMRNIYEGFWIMTPDGRRAGIWYSQYDQGFVRFPDESTIILYTPIIPVEGGRPRGYFIGPPH
ncbi:MAG: hypothetical protein M8357_03190 [Desulfobulbaceae bacterium]|nr:hypothetical protein [Desulfobulbaceae bacterium]